MSYVWFNAPTENWWHRHVSVSQNIYSIQERVGLIILWNCNFLDGLTKNWCQRGVNWRRPLELTRWTSFHLQSFFDIARMLIDSPSLSFVRRIWITLVFFQRVTAGWLSRGRWFSSGSIQFGKTFNRRSATRKEEFHTWKWKQECDCKTDSKNHNMIFSLGRENKWHLVFEK